MSTEFRIESDSMGDMQVPVNAYYGAQTARAVENFPISSLRFQRPFIRAMGLIKRHAAITNAELSQLDARLAKAIESAAQEVADGTLHSQPSHAGAEGIARRTQQKNPHIRFGPEDRPHSFAGRDAHSPRAGIRRLLQPGRT